MTDRKESKKAKPKSKISVYARFSGITFQMITIIGLGTYGGIKLDEKYPNKYSLFTVFCSLASVLLATYFVIRQVTKYSKKQ